jgi:polyisoprenyl-phosphate glycosyltransferase
VLSVVIPVYGCEPCLVSLASRLVGTLESLVASFEIVLVDDRDGSEAWTTIGRLAGEDSRVRGIRLSRNFGQHAAITAGLKAARGSWVIVMDCDLQDPPEEIPRLWAKAQEGFDIVYGRRAFKHGNAPRRLAGRMYFRLLSTFSGNDIEGEFGTFSLISRKVVDGFLHFRDQDRHYLLILRWLGFDWAAVDYEPAARTVGRSSYSFGRLIRHAMDGVFFQTTILLRWIVYLGFAFSLFGVLAAVGLVAAKLNGTIYPGWTSMAVISLLGTGFMITSTGVTGLYIGKVFDQVKDRPLFLVDRTTDPEADQPESMAPSASYEETELPMGRAR